jgi:hypothetical protein
MDHHRPGNHLALDVSHNTQQRPVEALALWKKAPAAPPSVGCCGQRAPRGNDFGGCMDIRR